MHEMWEKIRRKICSRFDGVVRLRKCQWYEKFLRFFLLSYSGSDKFDWDWMRLHEFLNYRKAHTKH